MRPMATTATTATPPTAAAGRASLVVVAAVRTPLVVLGAVVPIVAGDARVEMIGRTIDAVGAVAGRALTGGLIRTTVWRTRTLSAPIALVVLGAVGEIIAAGPRNRVVR